MDAGRRVFPEVADPVFIQQKAVGEDFRFAAQVLYVLIHFFEPGIRQALAAAQGHVEHPGFHGLGDQILPLTRRQQRLTQLIPGQAHIAHDAAEIAQRRQLKLAGDGRSLFPDLLRQVVGEIMESLPFLVVLPSQGFQKRTAVAVLTHRPSP